jgi:ABC-2 type transport system ATP-binding protein
MTNALLLEDVTKRYRTTTAVDNLSLAVPRGSIYGILGPNGAGKTTTLRMVMNILQPDQGRITMLDSEPHRDRKVLRRVGYLPEERGLHRRMKVIDVIVFFAQLKGVERREAARRGQDWLQRMDLGDRAQSKVDTLSKGMQQKVQFITTVLHEPDLLILDEPQSGLDPVNQEVMRDTIMTARAEGRTVALSTHNMSQAEAMCEYVCIISRGRKILDGRVGEIRRENRGDRYEIVFDGQSGQVDAFFRAGPFRNVSRNGPVWEVDLRQGTDSRSVLSQLTTLDVPVSRFEHVEPSLHEIFVERVSGDRATGNGGAAGPDSISTSRGSTHA